MADDLKTRVERSFGDQFVTWFNDRNNRGFSFDAHLEPPEPDLRYVDGDQILYVEVTGSHYDQDDARFLAMNARSLPNAPQAWSSLKGSGAVVSIDDGLVQFANKRLVDKADKSYRHQPILVLAHTSHYHQGDELLGIVDRILVPSSHPFTAIYLVAELRDRKVWVHRLDSE